MTSSYPQHFIETHHYVMIFTRLKSGNDSTTWQMMKSKALEGS